MNIVSLYNRALFLKEDPDTPPLNNNKKVEKWYNDKDAITFGCVNGVFFISGSEEVLHAELIDTVYGILYRYFGYDEQYNLSWKQFARDVRDGGITIYRINKATTPEQVYDTLAKRIKGYTPSGRSEFDIAGRFWEYPYNGTDTYVISFYNTKKVALKYINDVMGLFKTLGRDTDDIRFDFIDSKFGPISKFPSFKELYKNQDTVSAEEMHQRMTKQHLETDMAKKQAQRKVPAGWGSRSTTGGIEGLKARQKALTSESYDI